MNQIISCEKDYCLYNRGYICQCSIVVLSINHGGNIVCESFKDKDMEAWKNREVK